jgi:hypothetical protein
MNRFGPAVAIVAALAGVACAPHRLDPDHARDLRRLAVISRVAKGPAASVASAGAKGVPGEAAEEAAEESDRALAEALARQVRPFEMAERVRVSLLAHLPAAHPWTQVMPPIEVATALDSLLVEDATAPVDYAALQRRGVDSVLLLEVSEYGVHGRAGAVGLYMKGKGRLFVLGGPTLWSGALDYDQLEAGGDPADTAALGKGGFRDAVIELLDQMSARVAASLAGGR